MRFNPTLVSAFVLGLALCTTVTAKQPNQACTLCIINAPFDASPDCDLDTIATDNEPKNMTPKEKSCWCALASSDAYLRTCIKSSGCTEADVKQAFAGVSAIKDDVCVRGIPLPSSATRPAKVTSSSKPRRTSTRTTATTTRPAKVTSSSKVRRPSTRTTTAAARPTQLPNYTCQLCILNASLDASPDCDLDTVAMEDLNKKMTTKQKSCWCVLASNDAYLRKCIKRDGCTKAEVDYIFSRVSVSKDDVCVGVTPPTRPAKVASSGVHGL
ncbi:hypothetical protein BGX23_012776 [Mortierella sp. AD031]|nr:hypothetical protein BGX23_012776 [Mortierella sp. AD031]